MTDLVPSKISAGQRETCPQVGLTIAGHDPSGGAGATADLLTFAAHDVYGYSVLTALTAQSTLGVFEVERCGAEGIGQVLRRLWEDRPPDGIKIGMLGSGEVVATVAAFLEAKDLGKACKPLIPIVVDPVLHSSSGQSLLDEKGVACVRDRLLSLVDWATPNWTELAVLAERPVSSEAEAFEAMERLGARSRQLNLVATGGDQAEAVDLVRLADGTTHRLLGKHIASRATHGTGCAFSTALLCRLIRGEAALEAVRGAKAYVREAILQAPEIGQGRGPLDLLWPKRIACGTVS